MLNDQPSPYQNSSRIVVEHSPTPSSPLSSEFTPSEASSENIASDSSNRHRRSSKHKKRHRDNHREQHSGQRNEHERSKRHHRHTQTHIPRSDTHKSESEHQESNNNHENKPHSNHQHEEFAHNRPHSSTQHHRAGKRHHKHHRHTAKQDVTKQDATKQDATRQEFVKQEHQHESPQQSPQQFTEQSGIGEQVSADNHDRQHDRQHNQHKHIHNERQNKEHYNKRQSSHSVSETPSQRAFRSLTGQDKPLAQVGTPQERAEQHSTERQDDTRKTNKQSNKQDSKHQRPHHSKSPEHRAASHNDHERSGKQHSEQRNKQHNEQHSKQHNEQHSEQHNEQHSEQHNERVTAPLSAPVSQDSSSGTSDISARHIPADAVPDTTVTLNASAHSNTSPAQDSASSSQNRNEHRGSHRRDTRGETRSETRGEDNTSTKAHKITSSSPSTAQAGGYVVKRAMFTDYAYGVQGYEEEDESTTDTTEKEELVFPPAQPLGAPPMNLDVASLYGTGARGAAIRILSRVERSDTYLDKALEQELAESELSALDKALLTEIVHGVLRWQSKLDWVLTGFYHGEFVKCITPVKNAMRIALYQVMFLTKIPPFAAVNESVELIKRLKGARSANLVNAVLRNIMHNINNIRYPLRESDPTRYLSIMYAHPSWLVRRWLERFGEQDTETLLKTNNERPKISLRLNLLQGQREELIAFLDGQEVKHWDSPYDDRLLLVGSLSAVRDWQPYRSGWFSVQDTSAAAVVRLARPERGQTVVDFCSAPGGKSTFAAELMEDSGVVYAIDKYPEKLAAVRENAARLKLSSVCTFAADARTLQPRELRWMIEAHTQALQQSVAQTTPQTSSPQEFFLQPTGMHGSADNTFEKSISKFADSAQPINRRFDGKRFDGKRFDNRKQRGKTQRSEADSSFDIPPVEHFSNEPLADVVLVDAPCSGTGTLCKKPDIRWKLRADDISPLVKLQRDILRNAASFVKPGGVLVYSTCTIEPEENVANAEWFLSQFPDFRLDPAEQYVPAELCRDGYLQTFPHIHRTDGAFGARFVRSAAPLASSPVPEHTPNI